MRFAKRINPGRAGLQANTPRSSEPFTKGFASLHLFTFSASKVLNRKVKPKENPWKWARRVNSQELGSLGEAHGVVAPSQAGVRGELAAHGAHLVVHVHEEAVLHVLRD